MKYCSSKAAEPFNFPITDERWTLKPSLCFFVTEVTCTLHAWLLSPFLSILPIHHSTALVFYFELVRTFRQAPFLFTKLRRNRAMHHEFSCRLLQTIRIPTQFKTLLNDTPLIETWRNKISVSLALRLCYLNNLEIFFYQDTFIYISPGATRIHQNYGFVTSFRDDVERKLECT